MCGAKPPFPVCFVTCCLIKHSEKFAFVCNNYTSVSTVCVPVSTVCVPVSTVCVPVSTVCVPASTVCVPASTVCVPASTVCVPVSTVCVPVSTVCQNKVDPECNRVPRHANVWESLRCGWI